MWARVVEFMLACWLAISPFVFRHPSGVTFLWANDFTCAFLIATMALASYAPRLSRVHLLNLLLAGWLLAVGYLQPDGVTTSASQNHIVLALLLGILAIVPSRAADPPKAWIDFVDDQAEAN